MKSVCVILVFLYCLQACLGAYFNTVWYNWEAEITEAQYSFECNPASIPVADGIIPCMYMAAEGLHVQVYVKGLSDPSTTKTISKFSPYDDGYTTNMNDYGCCNNNPADMCNIHTYCMSVKTCTMTVYKVQDGIPKYADKGSCSVCRPTNCKNTCSNGQYASAYPEIEAVLKTNIARLDCNACEPGTWLTCQEQETCTWNIPETPPAPTNLGPNIYHLLNGPMLSCYPCVLAGGTLHYNYVGSTKYSLVDPTKAWICPGGALPPVNCPVNKVNDANYSSCVCHSGYFGKGDEACTICPPGNFCLNGEKTPCPLHQYQKDEGQTSCLSCTTTGLSTGQGMVVCNTGQQLAWCDPTVDNSQNQALGRNCMPCKQCKRPFVVDAGVAGMRNCYKG